MTRAQSIVFVLIGAAGLLMLGFLVVLTPAAIAATSAVLADVQDFLKRHDLVSQATSVPDFQRFVARYDIVRYGATSAILLTGLVMAHVWLPAGRRRLHSVWPGIAVTLTCWLAAAVFFRSLSGAVLDLRLDLRRLRRADDGAGVSLFPRGHLHRRRRTQCGDRRESGRCMN